MRSRMLGLAIALSTFGLGVAATALWLAICTPAATELDGLPVDGVQNGFYCMYCESARQGQANGFGSRYKTDPRSRDVLDGKARSRPVPTYPRAAREAGVSGVAVVHVTVGEDGRVRAANGIFGHHLLRRAAERAAYEARFEPFMVDGRPAEFYGTLSYNFLLQ